MATLLIKCSLASIRGHQLILLQLQKICFQGVSQFHLLQPSHTFLYIPRFAVLAHAVTGTFSSQRRDTNFNGNTVELLTFL